jgi:hypothetical protein
MSLGKLNKAHSGVAIFRMGVSARSVAQARCLRYLTLSRTRPDRGSCRHLILQLLNSCNFFEGKRQNEEVGLVGQESFPEFLRQTSFLASVKNAMS